MPRRKQSAPQPNATPAGSNVTLRDPEISFIEPPAADEAQIPEQKQHFQLPTRFGAVPVDEAPLGWEVETRPREVKVTRFQHAYPTIRLPFQEVQRVAFGHGEHFLAENEKQPNLRVLFPSIEVGQPEQGRRDRQRTVGLQPQARQVHLHPGLHLPARQKDRPAGAHRGIRVPEGRRVHRRLLGAGRPGRRADGGANDPGRIKSSKSAIDKSRRLRDNMAVSPR